MRSGERSIIPVDERDSSWEAGNPRFRVYLQTVPSRHESASTSTYDLMGYDVAEVLDWARARVSEGGECAIALVVDDDGRESIEPGTGRGLVWLHGRDLNSR